MKYEIRNQQILSTLSYLIGAQHKMKPSDWLILFNLCADGHFRLACHLYFNSISRRFKKL